MLKNKRIFISGGAGVIGKELVHKLDQMGAVLFVGDLKSKPKTWGDHIQYWQGDLNEITRKELDRFAPEYVFHLAATFERSTETYEFWDENDRHNVRLSHHLADCVKDLASLKKVVFTSSYLIYKPELYQFERAQTEAVRLGEEAEIDPRNLCGMAKLMHEKELQFLADFSDHLQTVSARIFRVYGKNSRDVISRWIRALLNGKDITVYRKEGLFDYIYAEQVAEGLVWLAVSEATGIVNLGSGRARRVSEVVEILRGHFPEMIAHDAESDIAYEASAANVDRLKKWTGWIPETQLEDAIPEMIEFEQNRLKEQKAPTRSGNVLVTSISRKVPLLKAVRKASARFDAERRLIGGDHDSECIGRHFVDEFWEMPLLTHLPVNTLIAYCREKNISAIIPTRDGELLYFAKHREVLSEAGVRAMISNEPAISNCLDKLKFYEEAKHLGYPVIETSSAIEGLNCEHYVVKDRFGAGADLIGLNLTKEQALHHADKLSEPIFQPYVDGQEYSVDLYVDQEGHPKGVIPRRREVILQGESQVTTTFRNDKLEQMCAGLAKDLQLYGHVVIQVLQESAGKFHIIECNSRVGGASHLSWEAGLDSLYWFLFEAASGKLDDVPFQRTDREKKLIRYPEDLIL